MTSRHAAVLTLVLGLHLPAAAQAPRQDGNWEITMQIEMDGVAPRLPARTTTQCVTKEEAADPKKAMPQGGDAMPSSCKTLEHKFEGNRVQWSFKCEAPHPMTGTGEIVYTNETSYTGIVTFTRDGRTMTMKYSGKRLGDCTKS